MTSRSKRERIFKTEGKVNVYEQLLILAREKCTSKEMLQKDYYNLHAYFIR